MAETLLAVCLGLGLAAACGFRVFVPLLVMSLAARTGHLDLAPAFDWISSTPALAAFAAATLLEVGAYYVPWLDHLLDLVATPAAVVAGVVVTASVVVGMDPLLRWTLAVIAGGGLAGAVQALTVGTRHLSTVTTAGLANPVVSTLEGGWSLLLAVGAVVSPLLALAAVAAVLLLIARRLLRRRRAA